MNDGLSTTFAEVPALLEPDGSSLRTSLGFLPQTTGTLWPESVRQWPPTVSHDGNGRLTEPPTSESATDDADGSASHRLPTPALSDGDRGPDLARAERPESGGMDLVTTVERLMPTLLPTPTEKAGANQSPSPGAARRPSLYLINELLPTPTAGDANSSGAANPDYARPGRNAGVTLTDAVVRGSGHMPPPTDETTDVFGDYAAAVTRHEHLVTGTPPPAPRTPTGRLSSHFVEWMMGLPPGWVTDPVIGLSRSAQLRRLGNGVVPIQGARAIGALLDRLEAQP